MSYRKSAPRVYMTARVTGTGDVALLDVYSANHNTFGQAYAPGDVAPYCIVGGGKQEIGDGTFIDENTFRRDTVWCTSENVQNSSTTTPTSKIVFPDNSDVQIFVAPHPWSVLQTNTDGTLANASPFRKSIALPLLADLAAEDTLTDGDAVYVMEVNRWFEWQASNATAADGVNIFEADAYDTGRWVGLGDDAGTLTVDGTAAAGAVVDLFAAKKATYPTRYARLLMDASSNAIRLAMRWGQASLVNFMSVFSNGNNSDRIEFHKPVVIPGRANLQGLMDNSLLIDTTNDELAFSIADAANNTTAADSLVIPRVKGTYLLGTYETIADLKAIDAAKYAKQNQRALVLGRADGGDLDPFYVEWFSTNADSADDWVTFRPSAGAAADGNGRWKRVIADRSQTVTNNATPSISSGNIIVLNSGASHPVTDILGEYSGAVAILIRGDEDVVITHDAAKMYLNARINKTLTLDSPLCLVQNVAGVWRELGGANQVDNVITEGETTRAPSQDAVAQGRKSIPWGAKAVKPGSSGDQGARLVLETNDGSSLNGDVIIDQFGPYIRFLESEAPYKGALLDLSAAAGGATSEIAFISDVMSVAADALQADQNLSDLDDKEAAFNNLRVKRAGTGAVSRSPKAKLGEIVTPQDFGGAADYAGIFDGTDNGPAFSAAIAYLQSIGGGTLMVPDGAYRIATAVAVDRSSSDSLGRVSIVGTTPNGVRIWSEVGGGTVSGQNLTGASALFTFKGNIANQAQHLVVSNLSLYSYAGGGLLGVALRAQLGAYMAFYNVNIEGFGQALDFENTDHIAFVNCRFRFNKFGADFYKGATDPDPGPADVRTQPNIIKFDGCTLANHDQWAIRTVGGANFVVEGGSVEGNNISTTTTGAIIVKDPGFEGGVACSFSGVYFEQNRGADLHFISTADVSNLTDATWRIDGCGFCRVSTATTNTNCIKVDWDAESEIGAQKLSITASTFKSTGTYGTDAGRPYIAFGGVQTPNHNNLHIGRDCIFEDAVETPAFCKRATSMPWEERGLAADVSLVSTVRTQLPLATSRLRGWSSMGTVTNGGFVFAEEGVYEINAQVVFSNALPGASGDVFMLELRLNGNTPSGGPTNGVVIGVATGGKGLDIVQVATKRWFSAGDAVYLTAYQQSGVTVDVQDDPSYSVIAISKAHD